MREAARPRLRPRRARHRTAAAAALLTTVALAATACSGGDDEPADDAAASETTSAESPTESSSPTASPEPEPPEEPGFASSAKGRRAFVTYIVEGWGYALRTNDASVLLDASGRKPCRGCDTLRDELRQRDREGWYVDFPGAEVRKVTVKSNGDVQQATAVVDIPASQSLFDDGSFRNDNEAHKGRKFLIDMQAEGKGDKRHWALLAFALQ
jgi:hypothetical protein